MSFKKLLTFAGIVLAFLVISYGYVPQVLAGKIVDQSDISGYVGMAHEANSWDADHPDDKALWTNSMFGGMPTTMLTGNDEGDWTKPVYDLFLTGKRPASYLFLSLLGAFLLMMAFGTHWLVAVGGAVAITFCSYNLQIIQVGHNSKMVALAFLPWVLAGVVYTYRSALEKHPDEKWFTPTALGAALFAMALNFQIKANHVQISYYLAIIIASYVLVLLVWLIADRSRRKLLGRFAAASVLLLVLGSAGIATNANRLMPTYSYTKETMRGGSELNADGKKTKGLDINYATAWSYGWEELPNMMIPDYNGGSSATAVNPTSSKTIKLLRNAGQGNLHQIAKALPLYWGPQPFTAGPMYMGAITIFLFVLGLCMYKGKEKWWLLIPTIIGIGLALGNHFMGFTKFWFNYMPFYNKFRTVSMALVILQFTLPVLGFLMLDYIKNQDIDKKEFRRNALIALIITAGFCLISATGLGRSFTGPADSGQQDILVDAFKADRLMLLRKDSLISMVLIILTAGVLYWSLCAKEDFMTYERKRIATWIICGLVLLNMGIVGKRYLNGDHFVSQNKFNQHFVERPVDKHILEDPDQSYRVLDLTANVFNDSHASYFHKNIGGYSPVKLQRYQDLIDHVLVSEINSIYKAVHGASTVQEATNAMPYLPVLSMLNDKYIILDGEAAPVENNAAFGDAWCVDSFVYTSTPEEEIAALGKVDLRNTAILGPDFADVPDISSKTPGVIKMTAYTPNKLRYHFESTEDKTVVFSEIYYPEWHLHRADTGESIELFRTNWTLRGAILPAGEYDLVMRFEPEVYELSSEISMVASIFLLLILAITVGVAAMPERRDV